MTKVIELTGPALGHLLDLYELSGAKQTFVSRMFQNDYPHYQLDSSQIKDAWDKHYFNNIPTSKKFSDDIIRSSYKRCEGDFFKMQFETGITKNTLKKRLENLGLSCKHTPYTGRKKV